MKNKLSLTIAGLMVASVGLFSCSATRTVNKTPFNNAKYRTDDDFYRAKGTSNNMSEGMARNMAIHDANVNLAREIQTSIDGVIKSYNNAAQSGQGKSFEKMDESVTTAYIAETLKNAKILEEISYVEKDGTYTFYVVVEKKIKEVTDNVAKGLSEDEKTKIAFDRYQFEKATKEGLEEYKKSRKAND